MRGKVLIVLGILCLCWSAKAKADDVAYAYCPSGEAYIYLYDSVGSFQVIGFVKCGDKVDVLNLADNNRASVRTSDGKQGYVAQSSLTATPPRKVVQQEPAPSVIKQQTVPAATAFTPFSTPGYGANVPRMEIFGGYSFMNAGTSGLANRENLNGFDSSLTVNVTRRLAGEVNFGGYFKTLNILNFGVWGFDDLIGTAGPRITVRKAFVHTLFGLDHVIGSTNFYAPGTSASDYSMAMALGGGVQWKITRHMDLRTSGDYVMSRFEGQMQSNIRLTVGVVFERGSLTPRPVELGQK